jgi:arginine-tRNA-protein transferase
MYRLIGVGVVDLLPHGMSSVYAFYDATFSRQVAALGKYISLQELLD